MGLYKDVYPSFIAMSWNGIDTGEPLIKVKIHIQVWFHI